MQSEPIIYEVQEFFVVTEIHDSPATRIHDDYNLAKHKPNPDFGHVNIEFPSHDQCIDYIRSREGKYVFQINKLYRRVVSTNEAYIAAQRYFLRQKLAQSL